MGKSIGMGVKVAAICARAGRSASGLSLGRERALDSLLFQRRPGEGYGSAVCSASMTLRFDTLDVGIARVEAHDVEFDARLVKRSDAAAFHVVLGGTLGEAHATPDEATAALAAGFSKVEWRGGASVRDGERPCPTCSAPVACWERYPSRLCIVCVLEAVDEQGRSLRFSNAAFSGGFLAMLADGTPYDSHVCWVRNTRCWADEARFGGIVLEPGP